jgi:hypothetical protein
MRSGRRASTPITRPKSKAVPNLAARPGAESAVMTTIHYTREGKGRLR